jgi:outer membrane receptor protein involved in Fe transport
VGGGNAALLNVMAGTFPATTDAVLFYGVPGGGFKRRVDVQYGVTAPYGSFNFHKGKIAIGGSLRYDAGKVEGTIAQDLATDVRAIDVNGDGIISGAEGRAQILPTSRNQPVDYDYHYLSYSAGINFRVSDPFAVFARYSRGSRAGADHLLFSQAISAQTGSLLNKSAGYDPVRQAEVGLKFRRDGVTLNLTGFWAKTTETNTQLLPDANGAQQLLLVNRSYRAYGAEFEGSVRRGPFSLSAGATLANAKITAAEDPALVGRTPRHQATLIFQARPQFDTGMVTIGANVIGTTSSYTQDVNQLKMPGYATVGAFVQVRPIERVELSLNASNLFNAQAITGVDSASIRQGNIGFAQMLYGRTISTSARFFF